MGNSCPIVDYDKPMDPRVGGRTLFDCDDNLCNPYKIEINPIHLNLFKKETKEYLKRNGITGKYLNELTDYLTNEYKKYIISHELVHYKFIEKNPEAIPKLMKKYGSAWRPILEGINDKQTVEQEGDLWKEFSPYKGEKELAKKLAKEDKEVEKYLMKDYDVSSCVPN